jgi:hypothetical protein
MFRSILIIIALLCVAGLSLGSAELFNFRAFAVIDHGQLEWSTGQETNLSRFIIERSPDGINFFAVGQLNPSGSYSQYEFTDRSPLDANVDRNFFYRIKLLDRDGNTRYSETREIVLSFSAVQQTWGSIKAMFR